MKLERYNADFYQIVTDDGKMVHGVTRLGNMKWRLTNMDDRTWGPQFDSPNDALEAYRAQPIPK